MVLVPFNSLLPKALAHKDCGGYVEHKLFLPSWYACQKCNALLHHNNTELVELPVVT